MKRTLCIALVLMIAGCAPSHDYLGDRYAPTELVEVFYPHEDVPEGYVVIGTNRTEASEGVEVEEIVARVVEKAREVGAHAVVIERFAIEFAGTTRTTDVDHDDDWYRERTRVSDRRVKVVDAVFLRRGAE